MPSVVRNKILMVYPLMGMAGSFVRHPPLSLLYASSELVKEGFEVEVLDLRINPHRWRDRLREAVDSRTLLVGISVMSGKPILSAMDISKHVKSLNPDVKVVWGGPFATFHPSGILLGDANCDYVISGYGSKAFQKLVRALLRDKKPADIKGVSFKDGGDIVSCKADWSKHEFVHWEDIPYHLIDDYSVYGQLDQDSRVFSVFSAMGCAYNCAFCSSPALYRDINGKRWQPYPLSGVVDHIEFLIDRYDADYIYFIDDDSFVSLKHVEDIIDIIEDRGVKVKLGFRGARINELMRMSDAFLDKLAGAGTDILHVGAESGSNRILKMIRKDCTVEDILAVNEKLARHPRIRVFYNFIVGLPSETIDDLRDTGRLILRLLEENPDCIIGMPNIFRPLPGTELMDIACRELGYEAPTTLEQAATVELEGTFRAPWMSPEHRKFCDMLMIMSYFVDHKVSKASQGKRIFYKMARLMDKIYSPVARLRVKHGYTGLFVERALYKMASAIISGREV